MHKRNQAVVVVVVVGNIQYRGNGNRLRQWTVDLSYPVNTPRNGHKKKPTNSIKG